MWSRCSVLAVLCIWGSVQYHCSGTERCPKCI